MDSSIQGLANELTDAQAAGLTTASKDSVRMVLDDPNDTTADPTGTTKKLGRKALQSLLSDLVEHRLGAGEAVIVPDATEIAFDLPEDDTVQAAASIDRANAGQDVTYTITRLSDGGIENTQTYEFIISNVENLEGTSIQPTVEAAASQVKLTAGKYRLTITVENDAIPNAIVIRRADRTTKNVMQMGCNAHSNPYVTKINSDVMVSGSVSGRNERFVTMLGAQTVDVLPTVAADFNDRYHSSCVILKSSTRYIVLGVDHNGTMKGQSATTIEGLSSATEVTIGTRTDLSYIKAAVSDSDKIYMISRSSVSGLMFYELNHETLATVEESFLIDDSMRHYPTNLQILKDDANNDLVAINWQLRLLENWETPLMAAVYDVANDEWRNIAGVLNEDGGGTSTADLRWPAATYDNEWNSGSNRGFRVVAAAPDKARYTPGIPCMSVDQWNATDKHVNLISVWNQKESEGNGHNECHIALVVAKAADDVDISAIFPGTDSDPFNVEPIDNFRIPASAWVVGSDAYAVIATTANRERLHPETDTRIRPYYDWGGHILLAYKIDTPFTTTDADDLHSKVSLIRRWEPEELGMGLSFDGGELDIFNIQPFADTTEFAIQVGLNMYDPTQQQGTVRIKDVLK